MDAFQIASSILGASVFTTLFTILALTVFGPAIIAYAAERGKILATKDNFEELKVQLAETTATAKRIEVEIEQGR